MIKAKNKRNSIKILSIALLCVGGAITAFILMVNGTKKSSPLAGRDAVSGSNVFSLSDITVSGFDQMHIEKSLPIQLPSATQYPKPAFDGTVTEVSPAWNEPSVIPDDYAHIDPDNLQSPPVKDFTITQCWKGAVQDKTFILESYFDFSESAYQSGWSYVALKTGRKVYITAVDPFDTLVSFCGPMVVFVRNSMSYTVMPIDLQTGNLVAESSDEIRSLAFAPPFDPSQSPNIPPYVKGITQKVATYPVCQTSASMPNPFNNPKSKTFSEEAWKHRIGNR